MARTQAADFDLKREAISRAAAKLFAKFGFAQTSVSKIADHCKISKSVIFHYHSTKEDILFSVMEAHMEELLSATDPSIYNKISKKNRFREFSRQLLSRYSGEADSQKVLLYELSNLPKKQREQIVEEQRILIDFAAGLLRDAVSPKRPDNTRLRTQVMLYFGMVNWSHTWFKSDSRVSRDQLANYAADTTTSTLT